LEFVNSHFNLKKQVHAAKLVYIAFRKLLVVGSLCLQEGARLSKRDLSRSFHAIKYYEADTKAFETPVTNYQSNAALSIGVRNLSGLLLTVLGIVEFLLVGSFYTALKVQVTNEG
jgi:hypothetical protein